MPPPTASASASSAVRRSGSIASTRSRTPASASSARRRRKMASAAERSLFWGTAGAVVVSDFITKMLAESLLARRLPLALLGDVVDIGVGGWRWPTFNVADSAITVGAIALAISLWQEGRAHQRTKEAQAA